MSAETKNFIAGKWVATGSTFGSVNPATGELVSRCAEASQQELDAAVAAACDAFPAWRKTPPPRRAEILFRVAELLQARKEDLARWITFEMGKVTMEARGDVQEAIDMARYMAGEGRRMFGHTVPSELPDKFCMSLRDPIGVVAVITPWNFPIAVPSWKILPAFVLGNTVVWKPSSDTPVCAAKFVEAFVEAGLPPGVLNLVLGKGAEIGDALVRHRDVRLVTFTGSNEVGHRVSVTAAETGKRCALEMGGKNAIIVLDDADLALAVDGIVWSAFGTSGQRCTAASRIIVHNTVRGPLTELLLERIKQLKIGNGLDPPTTVGPVINHAALKKSTVTSTSASTKARGCSSAANVFPTATAAADVSIVQQCLTMSHLRCASRATKSSAPWCASSKPAASKKPSPSTTTCPTASSVPFTPRTSTAHSPRCAS